MSAQPFTFPVERGKIREFARATRARRPEYDRDERPTIPPTWLAAAAFWAAPENSALDGTTLNWSRILHGAQEFVFHGPPPRAGDVLTARQRVEDVSTKEGRRGGTMTVTVLLTEYRDTAGELVAEARSTIIETSKAATS